MIRKIRQLLFSLLFFIYQTSFFTTTRNEQRPYNYRIYFILIKTVTRVWLSSRKYFFKIFRGIFYFYLTIKFETEPVTEKKGTFEYSNREYFENWKKKERQDRKAEKRVIGRWFPRWRHEEGVRARIIICSDKPLSTAASNKSRHNGVARWYGTPLHYSSRREDNAGGGIETRRRASKRTGTGNRRDEEGRRGGL